MRPGGWVVGNVGRCAWCRVGPVQRVVLHDGWRVVICPSARIFSGWQVCRPVKSGLVGRGRVGACGGSRLPVWHCFRPSTCHYSQHATARSVGCLAWPFQFFQTLQHWDWWLELRPMGKSRDVVLVVGIQAGRQVRVSTGTGKTIASLVSTHHCGQVIVHLSKFATTEGNGDCSAPLFD